MELILEALPSSTKAILKTIAETFSENKLYIYGGIVRDYLIEKFFQRKSAVIDTQDKEEEKDIDAIVLSDDFDDALTRLSSTVRTIFPALIKERTIRVVGPHGTTADVTILPRSADLSKYRFDFTVNTFLCDAHTLLKEGVSPIETPFEDSWNDIKEGILRAPKAEWLIEECFGALRGLRLYCQTGFNYDEQTLQVYPDALRKVRKEISPLLIVREFMKGISFSLKRFAVALHITYGDEIFLEPLRLYILQDPTKHVFSVCSAYDRLLSFPPDEGKFWEKWQEDGKKITRRLQNYQMGVTKYRNLLNLTALVVLLHDIGKAYSENEHEMISARLVLKLTDDLSFFPNERFFLYYVVRYHQMVHDAVYDDTHALTWFQNQSVPIKLALVLFGLADKLSQPPDQISDKTLEKYLSLVESVV